MLRSNTKKAVQNIRKYIFSNTDLSVYGIENPSDFHSLAVELMHIYFSERGKFKRQKVSYQEDFCDWLSGLPSVFDSCYFYNRSAVDDLGEILEETETEKSRYSEADAEKMLSYLIFRELYKACNYEIR